MRAATQEHPIWCSDMKGTADLGDLEADDGPFQRGFPEGDRVQ